MNIGSKRLGPLARLAIRQECTIRKTRKCKLLVVGGGTGGCNIAWRFSRKLQPKDIILLEPSDLHYYQPGFTLVAAGIVQLKRTYRPLCSLLPPGITWLQDQAEHFEPCDNTVYTRHGIKVVYDFMVVAVGLMNDFDKEITIYDNNDEHYSLQVSGLKQALDDPCSTVSTIYSPDYCSKTWCDIHLFKGGHAVFTYPVAGGKCAGAILKIMFLADDYWRKHKIRCKTSITFNTANSTIFGVPKYATALAKLASKRDITINYCTDLIEVNPAGAVFRGNGEYISFPYNMMVVSPRMIPPSCIRKCKTLVNSAGYLDVDMYTLQHCYFSNIFGIGDCTSTPNSKTAAAIGPQSYVLERNLTNVMAGKKPRASYNGYGACPLLTSYKTGILAEFIYDKKLWSTFLFDQAKERRIFYHMNVNLFPHLYWRFLLKGRYSGPSFLRKIMNPLGKN